MKQELIMHNLYFGCLATDSLDFLVKDIPQNVSLRAADCH